MPANFPLPALRFWLSWLAFAGAVFSCLADGSFIPTFVAEYGRDFPASLTPHLPLGTIWFLENISNIALVCRLSAAAGIVAAFFVARRSLTRESLANSILLIGAVLYYLAFMVLVMFILQFFILPHARAGI